MRQRMFGAFSLVWSTLVGLGILYCEEAPRPAVVAKVKQATAFVEKKNGMGSGSAFCISKDGYFVTCAHVVHPLVLGDKIDLTVNPGTPEQETHVASIERLARDKDVAVLKVEAGDFAFLGVGDSAKLRETQQIMVAGFPLGRVLGADEGLPSVTVSTGRVTALRRSEGRVGAVQIDAELNPGNSGGPIVDLEGNVVAMAASTVFLTDLNFGVSTTWVNAIVNSPLIRIPKVPPLPGAGEEFRLPFSLSYIRTPGEIGLGVRLVGEVSGVQELEVEALGEGEFVATGKPSAGGQQNLSATLRVEAIIQNGNVTHTQRYSLLDQEIEVGGEPRRLSDLAAILPAQNEVIDIQGERDEGKVTGISAMRKAGGQVGAVNLERGYDAILIRPETVVPEEVQVRLNIDTDGLTKTVTLPVEQGSADQFSNFPPPGRREFRFAADAKPPAVESRIELENEVVDLAWGGGGRFAVIRMVRSDELLVIDVQKGREAGRVPFDSKGGSFTVGADRIVLASGGEVEQWSLEPLERISGPQHWVLGEIDRVMMGPAWSGQVAVAYRAFGDERLQRLEFRDPESSRVLAIDPIGGLSGSMQLGAPAMLDSVIVVEQNSRSGKLMLWDRKGVRMGDELPSKSSVLGPMARRTAPPSHVTAQPGSAWLATTVPDLGLRLWGDEGKESSVDLVDLKSGRELVTSALTTDELGVSPDPSGAGSALLPLRKRLMAVPQLGFLAYVPKNHREFVIKPFDVWEVMERAGCDAVFVTAFPPPFVTRGEVCQFDLQPRGMGGIRSELESAPEGATISPEGVIKWTVEGESSRAKPWIVRLSSEGGAELLWRWDPHVR